MVEFLIRWTSTNVTEDKPKIKRGDFVMSYDSGTIIESVSNPVFRKLVISDLDDSTGRVYCCCTDTLKRQYYLDIDAMPVQFQTDLGNNDLVKTLVEISSYIVDRVV